MITQTIQFQTSPDELYALIMDEKKHAAFTKAEASIVNEEGGKFSVWDGYATGSNLELIPGKKIVQSWKASDWPEGKLSQVTYQLKAIPEGTELTFIHEHVPHEFEKDIEQGWEDYYWKPLKEYLKKHK